MDPQSLVLTMDYSLFVSDIAGLQLSKYFNVAGLAILLYDYAITLEDESRWVWGRPWDATRVIFTVSRYLPFIGVAFTTYDALRSPYGRCPSLSIEENVIHILGIIAAELLLVLRTYAFWGCSKRILYGLLAYAVVTVAGAVTMNIFPPHNLQYTGPAPGIFHTCQLVSDSRNPALVYAFLLAFELVVVFSLTVYRRFQDNWSQILRTSLVRTIYRDGVFYMVCIMFITLANIVADAGFAVQFSDMLDIPQITLHSVLASRIMFNIRKTAGGVHAGGTSEGGVILDTMSTSDLQWNVALPSEVPEDTMFGKSDEADTVEVGRTVQALGMV